MTMVGISDVGKRLLCECPNFKPKASRSWQVQLGLGPQNDRGRAALCGFDGATQCRQSPPPRLKTLKPGMGPIRDFVALIGVVPFLLVHGSVVGISDSVAVWLFHVQHQFEERTTGIGIFTKRRFMGART
jgi:hypothetical protein